LLTASGGKPRLLRNDQALGHHWLRVKLLGQPPNRDAIGSSVEVHSAGRILKRLVSPTRSYLSQCELPVTFGLGGASEIEKVVVRWPSGRSEEHTGLAIDKLHILHESAR
jgi:enediyne biosynthesis protein E4